MKEALQSGAAKGSLLVLHYVGYDQDRGGIVSVVRTLAGTTAFECVLGVNPGFVQRRNPPLPILELPRVDGETLGLRTFWRSRRVARAVHAWLADDSRRVFHAHSRAGLAVALWLARAGERRVVVSVHCYGRQRWFYRWAARQLESRLFWLSPAMKRYYGLPEDESWAGCMPGCVADAPLLPSARARREPGILRLGGIGLLVEWKGWHLVLDALASLSPAIRSRVRFSHLGGSDDSRESRHYAASLRAKAAALGVAAQVDWRGEQPTAEPFLDEIDVLVVASRREPLSIAMIEALRKGVPVLASKSGGNTDVITPPRNGWFFATDDVRDLKRAVQELATTDALARVDVQRDGVARFDARTVAAQWTAIYESCRAIR